MFFFSLQNSAGWTEWEDITVRDPNWMPIKPLGEYLFSVQTGPQDSNRILGIRFFLRSDESDDEGGLVNINVPPATGKTVFPLESDPLN